MSTHTTWDVLSENTQLCLCFGGVPEKNSQISQGLVGEHRVRDGLQLMSKAGVRFVTVSPVDTDLDTGVAHEWIPIRPNTDVALLLGIAYTLYAENLHDQDFLDTHCIGFEKFLPYLLGHEDRTLKTPEWASGITGVPATRIRDLARELASVRSMINMSWSLQRAHHGEQPVWALLTVASMLGQIGLPGGGFGFGYGPANGIGTMMPRFGGPTLSQGINAVKGFIPVARLADMLEKPGQEFNYNGAIHKYPDIQLIYWAGGNPFHHHQDLNRLLKVWRNPKAIIVNEQFWTPTAKTADIVFPATTTLEREDIGYASSERYMVAMRRAIEPVGEARDDYEIFSEISKRLGRHESFTEGRSSAEWLRHLYEESLPRARSAGVKLPEFDEFWQVGMFDLSPTPLKNVMLEKFRADPGLNPLSTPSGKIELFSEAIARFNYADCAGHAKWFEPQEWLGSRNVDQFPLHMISDQPFTKLHSQLDHSEYSRKNKIQSREPVILNVSDAQNRGIKEGDVVRVFNSRGSCLAGARLSTLIMPGVVKLSTGAWFDPTTWDTDKPLEKHGNPNVLTLDIGASQLSQGCVAQTCLVEIALVSDIPPEVTAFDPPSMAYWPASIV